MNHIAHNLKFYRLYNRLLQKEVAENLKVTVGMVKSYEAGTVPPIETLIKISDMMQISLDTLVKVKLNKNNYLKVKGQSDPDLLSRVEALEIAVNKNVNKKQKN